MADHLSQTRKSSGFAILFLAIILLIPVISGSGAGATVVPVPATFIITSIGNGASYNAYLSASPTIPFFTETNFSRIMNNDLLASSSCRLGCSIVLNPGSFNLSTGIFVTDPFISISGPPSAIVRSQNIAFSNNCSGSTRPIFCVTGSNFIANGFTIDDVARDTIGGVTGDVFFVASSSNVGLIQSMAILNASSNGIFIQGSNYVVTTSSLFGPAILPKTGGNFGVNIGGTASHIRIFLNTISKFNGSDVASIQTANGASYVSITSNDIFQNSFGIAVTCGKFVTINGNTIHNNYAGGMAFFTAAFGGPFACGPATLSGNIINDNGLEPNNDIQCSAFHCSGIEFDPVKCCWDSVSITGDSIKDTQAIHTQQSDIHIAGKPLTTCASTTCFFNLTITGNALGVSRGITLNNTMTPAATWIFSDNPGFNPQPIRGPLTAGASPFTYPNNDAYREQVAIIAVNGMTSLVCRGITQILTNGETTPILNTLDTCVFTWAVTAPTYDVLPT